MRKRAVHIATLLIAAAQPAFVQAAAPATQPGRGEATDDKEILIIQALDQPTDLDLKGAPIRAALEQLGGNTGIPIDMELHTQSFLPYGSQTRLDATIKGRPLRESLQALLRPLGLEFQATSEMVLVRPSPPLRRIGRRATWKELATLEKLASAPWSDELLQNLNIQATHIPGGYSKEGLAKQAKAKVRDSAAATLEYVTNEEGLTWYPEEDRIVILPKSAQIERQLDNTFVTLRYEQSSLQEALLDLARRAHVPLRMDPGVIASLPPQTSQRFSLALENASVRQALEVIVGQTGLGFLIDGESIRLTSNLNTPSAQPDAALQAAYKAMRTNPIIGEFTLPGPDGKTFSFFLREDDLPPDLNQLRKDRIREIVEQMRDTLRADAHKN